MTRQRALRLAREWAQGHVCSLRNGEAEEYHAMFVAMLEKSMPNEPLTIQQLREMDGEPAYLYIYDTALSSGWHIIKAVTEDKIIFRELDTVYVLVSALGKCFDLYAFPPARIDREAWTAEWIYPENEWNLPECSKCGCNSEDAQYKHKNNFCPKCGRAMTPEAWAEMEKRIRG